MKIEKLDENKIKITFNSEYLKTNHISVHSFMSNSIESQNLLENMLIMAEKEVGFSTENYKISIEALTQNKDLFTLIVSRFSDAPNIKEKARLRISRKSASFENHISLFKFNSLENFFIFSKFLLEKNPDISEFLKDKNSLYFYNECYFLAITKLNLDKKLLFKITSIFAEFSEFLHVSENTFQKLKEVGNVLISDNAILNCKAKK